MKDLIKHILMEEIIEGGKPKYTEDEIMTTACKFKNKRDFMKNEPKLYRAAYNRELLFRITQECKYKPLGNLYNRMLYMYVWDKPELKAVYFGLTCDEDRRFREHTLEYDEMEEVETAPGCKVGSSSVNKFIQKNGKYDRYYQLTEGYIKAEIAALLEMCAIAHFREDEEFKGKVIVVNRTKGGELGGRCARNARPIIKDAENILKKEIKSSDIFAKEFPTANKYWSSTPDRKKTMNKQLDFRLFDDAPYRKVEILDLIKNYSNFEDFKRDNKRAAMAVRRKKMNEILFPTENIFYNQKTEKTYNTFKEVVDDLKLDFIEDYFVFERNQNEEKFGILLIPKDSVKDIEEIPDDLVESFFRQLNEDKTPEERTLKYLSNLNLEPWEDVEYNMEYLVVPNSRQIIFLLVKNDLECSIQNHFYTMLKMFFKDDEQEMTYFVYDYLKENGLNLPFHKEDFWLSSSPENGVANREEGDRPMKKRQINESTEMETLKRYFYKKWDREKKEGKRPTIFDLDKLGLSKFRNEIIMLFSEYMGYNDVNSRTETIKNYLMDGPFSEDDITEMDNFDQGKIQVKFNKIEFNEKIRYKFLIELDIEFEVLSGSFYNNEDGETYHFSSNNNPFDDFVTYFEFKEEIEHVVESFVFKVIESFGFNINNDFDYISVKW